MNRRSTTPSVVRILVFLSVALSVGFSFPLPVAAQAPPAEVKPAKSTTKTVEIVGSDKFKRQVTKALALLKKKAPEDYKLVATYVGRIEQGKHSGMWAYKTPPTYELADRTAFHSVMWCASTIAHDAYHSKLYHDYEKKHASVPNEIWTGVDAEKKGIAYQLTVMKKIGSSKREIEHVLKQDGTHHDVDGDGDFDWDDYRKRDW